VAERFGGFELVSRIGAGGMAETFRAVRRGPQGIEQHVCIKRILPAWQGDPRFRRMFLEEARIAASLRHQTIVQVIEAGEHEGAPFLALELVEGTDLRRMIDGLRARGRRIPPSLLTLVALDVATALELAHREGVMHRDVSPANVLVSEAGEVKLTDFGIAKASDSERVTATGFAKGKHAYMAPEYAASGVATPRTDLYSLGVALFEAATGARPARASTRAATRGGARGARERAPDAELARLAPEVPAELARIIERLIAQDPYARFPGAEALFDALASLRPGPAARRALGALAREVAQTPPPAVDPDRTLPCEPPAFEEATRALRAPVRPVEGRSSAA
jgi:eukaryotic-like serine/threonine-protein kinase